MTITLEQLENWDAEVIFWKIRAQEAEAELAELKKDAKYFAEHASIGLNEPEFDQLKAARDRILEATKEGE